MKIKVKQGLIIAAAIVTGIFTAGASIFLPAVSSVPAVESRPMIFSVNISDGRIWR